jgi:hypothetical protein
VEAHRAAQWWRHTYARQAVSDFEVYTLLSQEGELPACHRMHYLQMSLEKAAKAHFWSGPGAGAAKSKVNRTHQVAEKYLPAVYKAFWYKTRGKTIIPGNVLKAAKLLCQEVDLLAPAVYDEMQRLDNCEYPWAVVDNEETTAVHSPLDHLFAPEAMVRRPGTSTFLKAVLASVNDIVEEGVPA